MINKTWHPFHVHLNDPILLFQVLKSDTKYTRCIHKVSSICKYCHCGHYGAHACRVSWSFWKAWTQFADNQTMFTHHPVCLQCSRKRVAHCICNVVCNPFLECKKHETSWHLSSTLWGIWRTCYEWFNGKEMRDISMNDTKMCMMFRGVADRLWLMKIWYMQWKRRFKRTGDSTFHCFPCIFHKFQGQFFTELCLKNFIFGKCVHTGHLRYLRMNTKWNGRPMHWPFWHDTMSKAMTTWAA
jgi:hypothetical protein